MACKGFLAPLSVSPLSYLLSPFLFFFLFISNSFCFYFSPNPRNPLSPSTHAYTSLPQSYPPLTPHSLLATALVFSPQTVKLLGTVVFMYYLSFLLSICSFTQGNLPSIHMSQPKLLLQSTPCPPWCKSNHHFSLRSRI